MDKETEFMKINITTKTGSFRSWLLKILTKHWQIIIGLSTGYIIARFVANHFYR